MGDVSSERLDGFRREHRERLFGRFQARSTSFATLFAAVLAFSVAFFAFVLVPSVALEHAKQDSGRRLEAAAQALATKAAASGEISAKLASLRKAVAAKDGQLAQLNRQLQENAATSEALDERLAAKQAEIARSEAKRAEKESALAALGTAPESIALLTFDPAAHTEELRRHLQPLEGNHGEGAPAGATCAHDNPDERLSCLAWTKVDEQIKAIFQAAEGQLVPVVARLDRPAAERFKGRLLDLNQDLERRQLKDPDFWRTLAEKRAFYELVKEEFDLFLNDLQRIVEEEAARLGNDVAERQAALADLIRQREELEEEAGAIRAERDRLAVESAALQEEAASIRTARAAAQDQREALRHEVVQLEKEKIGLDKKRKLVESEQAAIAQHMQSLQSPFGTLPIGLAEGILAFPLVVAAGFLVCATAMADAIRLRAGFHRLCRELDPRADVLTDRQVALAAPLWLDPLGPAGRRLGLLAVFLAPALIFVAAVALIGYGWWIGDGALLGGPVARSVYGALYLPAGVAVIIALAVVRAAYRAYGGLAVPAHSANSPAPSEPLPAA